MAKARHKAAGKRAPGKPRTNVPHRDFGARLARLRAAAALTQRELAERIGVSRRQIAYYESGNGRPPGALLGLLADLFRVSTDVLLGRTVSKAPASRLSQAILGRLHEIERMGAAVCRRLEAELEKFIVAERSRKATARKGRRGTRAPRRAARAG